MSDVSISGSIHQGSEHFSEESRGEQCSFISLTALLFHQYQPVQLWSTDTVDEAYSINIGKSERTARTTYFALCRVNILSCCVMEPMIERLGKIILSANFKLTDYKKSKD